MKERPILFCSDMVRAILDGRKTETRRLIKGGFVVDEHSDTGQPWPLCPSYYNDGETEGMPIPCPHGQVGDRLWVREAWAIEGGAPDDYDRIYYRATPDIEQLTDGRSVSADGGVVHITEHKWRPSIFMPRWASRITLEITNVRVERLHDITEEGARAEGVVPRCDCPHDYAQYWGDDPHNHHCPRSRQTIHRAPHRDAYSHLWDELNAKRATWESDPFVWVLQFRRVS